jgi:hypothetical protein
VLERALLVINTPYTYFTILCDELAVASTGFAATVCTHGSTATHRVALHDALDQACTPQTCSWTRPARRWGSLMPRPLQVGLAGWGC